MKVSIGDKRKQVMDLAGTWRCWKKGKRRR